MDEIKTRVKALSEEIDELVTHITFRSDQKRISLNEILDEHKDAGVSLSEESMNVVGGMHADLAAMDDIIEMLEEAQNYVEEALDEF